MKTFWFYRYKKVDEKGWTLLISKFFCLSKFGEEKYIKANGGKKYSLTLFSKMLFRF